MLSYMPERYRLSAEFIEVLKKFWTEDWFDYTGRYFTIHQEGCESKPVQRPHPPLYNAAWRPFLRQYHFSLLTTLSNGSFLAKRRQFSSRISSHFWRYGAP